MFQTSSLDKTSKITYAPWSEIHSFHGVFVTTQLLLQSEGERQSLQDTIGYRYVHGECYRFAYAMHTLLGWQIVGYDSQKYTLVHVGVRDPDGMVWDARGPVTDAEFLAPFADSDATRVYNVTTDDLLRGDPYIRFVVQSAERYIAECFPDLPLPPTSERSRVIAFMNAVEALCRETGIWIAGHSAEHLAPILWAGVGDEIEYAAQAYGDHWFTFDRTLEGDSLTRPRAMPADMRNFLVCLAALSHEHKFWVSSGTPTTRPKLTRMDDGNHRHYAMRMTLNLSGYHLMLRRKH